MGERKYTGGTLTVTNMEITEWTCEAVQGALASIESAVQRSIEEGVESEGGLEALNYVLALIASEKQGW